MVYEERKKDYLCLMANIFYSFVFSGNHQSRHQFFYAWQFLIAFSSLLFFCCCLFEMTSHMTMNYGNVYWWKGKDASFSPWHLLFCFFAHHLSQEFWNFIVSYIKSFWIFDVWMENEKRELFLVALSIQFSSKDGSFRLSLERKSLKSTDRFWLTPHLSGFYYRGFTSRP